MQQVYAHAKATVTADNLLYVPYVCLSVTYLSNLSSTGRRRSGTPYLVIWQKAACIIDFKKLY